MTPKKGEIWIANLNLTRGSEQAGIRPVVIFQNDLINRYTSTILAIPLTTNLKRAALPSCLLIPKGEGGLNRDSVALCHQFRVLDKKRLDKKLGMLHSRTIEALEACMLFTPGII